MLGDNPVESERRDVFLTAISSSPDELGDSQVRPWELEAPTHEVIEQRKEVKQVIFVIHGIRDEGYWTDKLARRVWQKSDKPKPEKVTDTYGYFGMGPF